MSDWTEERIAAEIKVCESATSAPWASCGSDVDNGRRAMDRDYQHIAEAGRDGDAAFIAASRSGYPQALAEIRRLNLEIKDGHNRELDLTYGLCCARGEIEPPQGHEEDVGPLVLATRRERDERRARLLEIAATFNRWANGMAPEDPAAMRAALGAIGAALGPPF